MMATATTRPAGALPARLHRLSLDTYRRMGQLGLLTPADRVVLLDGLLVRKMTKNPPLVASVELARDALNSVLPAGWYVRKEDPITLPDGPEGAASEPEPDLAVVAGTKSDYATRHPGPADLALIVEVADSSLAEDRDGLRRYAWAGLPRVWIVNLANHTVEVYAGPSGRSARPGYAACEIKRRGDVVPVLIGGEDFGAIPVDSLLL
jgi:Putative restriction endonuclease